MTRSVVYTCDLCDREITEDMYYAIMQAPNEIALTSANVLHAHKFCLDAEVSDRRARRAKQHEEEQER